jgi:hypothetical protein
MIATMALQQMIEDIDLGHEDDGRPELSALDDMDIDGPEVDEDMLQLGL